METRNQPVTPALQPAVEHRTAQLSGVVIRAAGQASGGDYMTFTGKAAVFDASSLPLYDWWYGEYVERIAPGAFTNVLSRNPDCHLVYVHDMASAMARTLSGTLKLRQDPEDLDVYAQLDPSDLDVQRVTPKMARGDVDQMSFAFTVARDNWLIEELADGTERVTRTILEIGELFDVSIVPQGAYNQTSAQLASARSRITAAAERGLVPRPEAREGKVLSTANQSLVQEAVDALQSLLDSSESERGRAGAEHFRTLAVDVDPVAVRSWLEAFIENDSEIDHRAALAAVERIDHAFRALPDAVTGRDGESPSGTAEPVAQEGPAGEVAHAREVEVMRQQVALATHLATTPKES